MLLFVYLIGTEVELLKILSVFQYGMELVLEKILLGPNYVLLLGLAFDVMSSILCTGLSAFAGHYAMIF
jgi:hypothetical protein